MYIANPRLLFIESSGEEYAAGLDEELNNVHRIVKASPIRAMAGDELYRAAADEKLAANPHAKEVLLYRQALWHGFNSLKKKPLATNLFVEIAEIIKGKNIGIRKVPGTKIANSKGEVIYTPPEGESIIRDKLSNLEKFLHAEDNIDPLIKMAALHYQFEAIHPFVDGNGRTGRIINILFLVEKGLLDSPILFLSHYILRTKPSYYTGLRNVQKRMLGLTG
jgi:Fic family protein